jgi:hypothetical protein
MHSLGIYRTGCEFGSRCAHRHERPDGEPPENKLGAAPDSATKVAVNTTGAVPETNGGQQVLKELQMADVKDRGFSLVPNKTTWWIKNNKTWLQPANDGESLCQNCEEGHSHITKCSDGGCHSKLTHEMACALATSAVETAQPFTWLPYETQTRQANSLSVLVTGTRNKDTRRVEIKLPATRAEAAGGRFCYTINAKSMADACLYDSD